LSQTEKQTCLKKCKIVGIPESKIAVKNPFSEEYDLFSRLDLSFAYKNIRLATEF